MNTTKQTNKEILIINLLLFLSIVVLLTDGISPALAGGTSSAQMVYWRFRDDSTALNTTGGWLTAAENQQATNLVKGTTYRVRMNLSQEGTKKATFSTALFQYGTNSDCVSGSWTTIPVTATTEHFQMADSGQFTNGDATTANLLTASEPTWFNYYGYDNQATTSPITLEIDYYTEVEFSFTPTSNATNGGTYYMRFSTLDSYPTCASLTLETPVAYTISGTAYTDDTEGSTLNSSGGTVKLVNSTTGATWSDADGTDGSGLWSITISALPSNGDDLVIWLNGAAADATLVVTYGATCTGYTNCTGLKMYQNRVIVRDENSTTITNADLADCDNDSGTNCADTEIGFTSNGGTLTVADGRIFYVWTGDEFVPGGTTVFDDIKIVGTYTAGASESITVSGDWMNTGTFTASSSTITFDAADTGNIIEAGSSGFNNLTFIGSDGSGTWTAQTNDFTVSGTIDVDTSDIFTIDTGRILTHTGATMTLDGDITGAGRLRFTSASGGPGAGAGTLSAITRYDASGGNIASTTFDARTYSGLVEIYSDNSAGAAREVAMANASYTLSGGTSHLYVINESATYTLTLDGVLNPTVAVGGDLDFTGSGGSSEIITSGTGTWTVSGNVNFTDGTYTATAGNTLVMSGSGTLTSNAQTLQNLTLSGTITLAAATHTVAGNLNMAGGSVTATGSIISMTGTSNSIVGGSNTLNALTIDPSSAGTITLQTSDLTVSGTLTVASGDELAIDTVTLTHTDISDVAGTGTVSGSGTLTFIDTSGGPGSTITTYSCAIRFDATAANIPQATIDSRTYNGRLEFYNNSASTRLATTLGSYTLSGATSHLYVVAAGDGDMTFRMTLDNGDITIGGDLDFTGAGAGGEIIQTGTGTWTVGGNADFTGGTFTATSGNTFQMNGSSKTITSATHSMQNFTVTGGSVANADAMTVAGNFQVNNTATFTLDSTANLTVTGDNFVIQDGGTYTKSDTSAILILDGISDNQWFDDQSTGAKQDMGDVQIGQSPGTTKLKADFAAASLTIFDGDAFETHGWEVDLTGALDCQGACILDLENDAPNNDADGSTITFGGAWTMSATGTFIPFTNSTVEPDGTADQAVSTGGKAFYNFYSNNGGASDDVDDVVVTGAFTVNGELTVNDGELDLTTNDPVTDIAGNVSITSGVELNASDSSSFTVAGSWDNNGTFTSNSGTVTFDSDADSETIEAGAQSFGNVVFNHASGDWTIQTDNMTTTGDCTLTAGTSFSVASVTLEIQGNLDLSVSGANTTWTGSTLYLNGSGGMYDINTKSHGGDTFATLRVGASEDISMWDSSAGTYTIDVGGCLYSQDHATTAGRLNIYGTCSARTNEYWSYAKDFDGTAVTRQADVRLAPSASYTVDNGDSLEIIGQSAAANRSLITRDSTGTYSLTVDGTINAQYYDFDYADTSGLNITSNATVTELSDGSFDNAGAASASYISVTGITSDDIFRNNVFDDNGDGADSNALYNVDADGANIYWKFLTWSGNKGGESFDNEANNATVDWSENLSFVLSANVVNLGTINTLTVGTGNHNLTVTTNATNGYTCKAAEDGNMRNGANDIDDVSDNTVTAGSEEYGLSCSGADCQLGANDVAITGTPLTVASNAGRVSASATTMTYEAAAAPTTLGLSYSHIVIYTCAGDF